MNLANSNEIYRKSPWVKCAILARFCTAFGILFGAFMKQIPLSQGKYALVDDEDYEVLNVFKWYYSKGYAVRNIKTLIGKRLISMHTIIMKPLKKTEVDHIDNNGLNNQKSNLRICSHQQNMHNCRIRRTNTTGFKGVYFDKKRNNYQANIWLNNNIIHLGRFKTPEEAARIYDNAALKYHGEFAKQNG